MKKSNVTLTENVFFKKLLEHSQEGITLLDSDFKVIYRSTSSQRIHGYDILDKNNAEIANLIHPDDAKRIGQLLLELKEHPGASKTSTLRAIHAKGHYIWIECTYTNMLDEPEVKAIVCNFRDITPQKESEELLQRSIGELSAYKYALDEAAIVAITDHKGLITHVNDYFCKISGYSREELLGTDHRIINSSYHSKSFIRNLWQTIAKGGIWKDELKNKAKDGNYYWVDTTIIPFLNKEGKPYQYVAIRSDITQRKTVQEKIVESERFIKTLTDHLPAMITYWTADLHCLFANRAVLVWLDKTESQVIGKHKGEIYGADDLEINRPYIENVLAGEQQSFDRSYQVDGKKIYTHTHYVPDIQDNDVKGFYSLSYDYSDIRTAELEVLDKTTQIENLLENITDGFIALDENRCYTYANQQIGKMLGLDPKAIIGKNIWELFPEAVGSETYRVIEQAYLKQEYVWNEDYYAPLNLWQENRVYPSGKGLSIFIRDISARKNDEIEKSIISTIRQIFNADSDLGQSLTSILKHLASLGNFCLTEAWLIDTDRKRISQVAKFSTKDCSALNDPKEEGTVYKKGDGLPGITWKEKKLQYWEDIDQDTRFIRIRSAKKSGLKAAYGVPLFNNHKIIGVLVLARNSNESGLNVFTNSFYNIGIHLGSEIKRKQLEQELNQVFKFTPDVLCIASIDGYFKKVNPAMSVLLEYSQEELLARPIVDFVHPLDREKTVLELELIRAGSPSYYVENRYITKSGKVKWLAWTTSGANSQGMLYGSAKEITAQKELQELLDKANSLARIGGWEIDLLANTVYWSEITREIHETGPDYVPTLKKGLYFYKKGKNRKQITQKLKEVIQKGTICDEELEIITAKGNSKWVRVIAEAEFADGKCIRVHGSFQDINSLKNAELKANEVLEERNTILESIADAFFAVDKNWKVTYWNNSAAKVLHRSKEEALNQNLWDIFSEAHQPLSYQKYHEAIHLNTPVHFEDHYVTLHKWYEISAYPSKAGLSVYFKDITERKISELLLNDLNVSLHQQAKELADSNAELEQFAYVASHDLQEPLRMVTSFLTQLELKYTDKLDDRAKKYIHFAVDGAKRMRQIILDLLEFSRVGRFEAQMEEVDVAQLIDDILVLYRKEIDEQQTQVDCMKMPIVHSYKVPLRQLFQNLIGNALKYRHPDRKVKIDITCTETDTHFQFAVKDNGIGIEDEYFEKIFVIFQRLHNKDEYSGTGMGLAIAKKIVENLGGNIWLESKAGEGTTFYFTIEKRNKA